MSIEELTNRVMDLERRYTLLEDEWHTTSISAAEFRVQLANTTKQIQDLKVELISIIVSASDKQYKLIKVLLAALVTLLAGTKFAPDILSTLLK